MVELQQTAEGTLDIVVDKFDLIMNTIAVAFPVAIFLLVLFAAIRIGWDFGKWILVAAAIVYLLNNSILG